MPKHYRIVKCTKEDNSQQIFEENFQCKIVAVISRNIMLTTHIQASFLERERLRILKKDKPKMPIEESITPCE